MQEILDLFQQALAQMEGCSDARLVITRATAEKFGDFQTNVAMQLAKPLKKPPLEIAQTIVEKLPPNQILQKCEIAAPGFINIFLSPRFLATQLNQMINSKAMGIHQTGEGKTILVDYSSPNVAKTMHVAHLRSTIIGDALKRIYAAEGYRVIADNHVGDWGTQFGKLLVAWKKLNHQKDLEGVELLEWLYQEFNRQAETNPALEEEARQELVLLQQKQEPNYSLWQQFIRISMQEFDSVYQRLGIHFDYALGESFYNEFLSDTVETLKKNGIARESEGAIVAFFEEDRFPPCVVKKKDGAFLYSTTDIATVLYRMERFKPEKIVYVTDNRQKLHFQQFFDIVNRLGVTTKLEHVMFGLMKFGPGVVMSSRKGEVIKLKSLLDEAEQRAYDVMEGMNYEPELRQQIAQVVAMGAIKYQDLSQNPTSDIHFEWDKALNLQGNSAPYLQYAVARVHGLLRKSDQKLPESINTSHHDLEKSLILHILDFPKTVAKASETSRPNLIAEYLFDLAGRFATFYNQLDIVRENDEAIRHDRLYLSLCTSKVLVYGLDLLGIKTVERM